MEEFLLAHPLIKRFSIPLVLGFLGLILIGYGLITSTSSPAPTQTITFDKSPTQPVTSKVPETIIIDVEGAVQKPGVYHIAKNARIGDAIAIAGGFSDQADHSRIAKQINLAQPLVDGTKVYIPLVGETDVILGSSTNTSDGGGGLININSASAKDLDTLSGVGEVTAQKIIANRPYQSLEELVSKKAVSKSVFEKIKDQLTLY